MDKSRLSSPSRLISLKEALYGESKFRGGKIPNVYNSNDPIWQDSEEEKTQRLLKAKMARKPMIVEVFSEEEYQQMEQ